MSGILYVVATPIGNLKDITLRAIETLKSVDLIACEDTRRTGILLKTYDIQTPTTSYHSYSKTKKHRRILDELECGSRVALVSDAGMPGISDPGAALIGDAIKVGIPLRVVPGASASLAALALSGFPADKFAFEGFLSAKPGARRKRIENLGDESRTVVIYESPHRLLRTLADIENVLGNIKMSVSRELTKIFEETRREKVSRLREHFSRHCPKGEFVLVLPPKRMRDG